MSFWCLAPSPLMLGGNLPDNTDWDLSILTNDEILSVDQDALAKPAAPIAQQGAGTEKTEVWLRELKDGCRVVCFCNRGEKAAEISLPLESRKLTDSWAARDLCEHRDLGSFTVRISRTVPPHGAALLRLVPNK